MKEFHLSDRELIMAMDGELSAKDSARVVSHLEACWSCRARKRELESAIADFVQDYRESAPATLPLSDGRRARLKARLGVISEQERSAWWQPWQGWRYARLAAVTVGFLLVAILADRQVLHRQMSAVVFAAPNPSLTPGAAVFERPEQLCRESLPKNKDVPASLRRRVLEEYGLENAPEKAYEVDYLITPALGGSDDIHNLWPHSYTNTAWSAKVKDSLEDRLHELVCQGQLDLPTAQREIAANWIEAYKKYFHTDKPIPSTEIRKN